MQNPTRHRSSLPVDGGLRECRTARGNLPVTHRGLWRFVLEQLTGPALRLHRHRLHSAQLLEDLLQADNDRCPS